MTHKIIFSIIFKVFFRHFNKESGFCPDYSKYYPDKIWIKRIMEKPGLNLNKMSLGMSKNLVTSG